MSFFIRISEKNAFYERESIIRRFEDLGVWLIRVT